MKQVTSQQIEQMLRELPRTANEQLGGLTAGPHLKARIERAASSPLPAKVRFSMPQMMPVLCGAMALVLLLVVTPMAMRKPDPLITAGPLGPGSTSEPVMAANLSGGLGASDIRISKGHNVPGYRSVWAESRNGSFPLVGIQGKYYRLLTSPRNVDSSLWGNELGRISEYTTEPSLSGTDVVLSNVVPFGQPVYAIHGMGDTLVTAQVDGQMRLFQRVSFNGSARRGHEELADTLQVEGRVIALELSDVGTITEPDVCAELMNILFDCASYESSGSISSKQSLLIETDTGLVLQMAVRNDRLAACGTWSCPEFLEAFEFACNN